MEKNDAAEQFYHTYYRLIYRTAKRLCRTKEAQEELIQDSLLRFLKNLAYYTERNSDETAALIVLTMPTPSLSPKPPSRMLQITRCSATACSIP